MRIQKKHFFWVIPLCIVVLTSINHAFPSVNDQSDSMDFPFELHGTIIGSKSLAFIYNTETGKNGIYHLNGEIDGYQITAIVPGKVLLEKNGKVSELGLAPHDANVSVNSQSEVYTDISGTTVVTRMHLVKQIPKANELLSKLKILPIPQADSLKLRGFRVDNVPPGSIVDEVGIKSGDIVYSVEGKELHSTPDAWDAFNTVKSRSRFEVVLLRDDKSVTLKYRIKN